MDYTFYLQNRSKFYKSHCICEKLVTDQKEKEISFKSFMKTSLLSNDSNNSNDASLDKQEN